MGTTVHFGVATSTDWTSGKGVPVTRVLPPAFETAVDSFRAWGEAGNDGTLHVITHFDYTPTAYGVALLAGALGRKLQDNERLCDYAVLTDRHDWAQDVSVVLFDGSEAAVPPFKGDRGPGHTFIGTRSDDFAEPQRFVHTEPSTTLAACRCVESGHYHVHTEILSDIAAVIDDGHPVTIDSYVPPEDMESTYADSGTDDDNAHE